MQEALWDPQVFKSMDSSRLQSTCIMYFCDTDASQMPIY